MDVAITGTIKFTVEMEDCEAPTRSSISFKAFVAFGSGEARMSISLAMASGKWKAAARFDTIEVEVKNTDDCVSFNPNTSAFVIQHLACTGSHGISVGSLGRCFGQTDVGEDLYVYKTSMADASDGARLSRIRNVTYHGFRSRNTDSAIAVDQCYGHKNATLCRAHPSRVEMEEVLFNDVTGTTSKRFDPQAGQLVCSAPELSLIHHQGQLVGREPLWVCEGFDTSHLRLKCQKRTKSATSSYVKRC
ncbi:uncharacterized protein PpBr36_09535 [Pyricularia pennisetigena]|uniref:uncharacterized protein n=1 Tax=Pyricularia pennisetigena TaxID=1578925 RepID=UPI00114FFCFB|nr:uncharacterized protein PpBr36_09535 [Pyricularia pennisetigena]TLS21928.1 hypothetical protein PpBr36_09535 [Pyricularia pennisetigena]